MEITTEHLAVISIIVNAILVTVIIKQYKFSQNQFHSKSRPWLVLGQGDKLVFDNSLDLYLENIGELPAQNISIRFQHIRYEDGKKIPQELEKDVVTIGIIVPKQKHHFTLDCFDADTMMTNEEFDADIIVTYQFGKEEKLSKFNYFYHRLLEHHEIKCIEAT